jgi:hypothetical protein
MSERLPWHKFSWTAWETDDELAMCSMGAQGLWMRLLCMAAKEDGIVSVAGKAPTVEKLAHLTRQTVENVTEWLAELDSRRMARDARISRKNTENGKRGGSPILCNHSGNSQSVKADKDKEEETEKESMSDQPDEKPSDRIRLTEADVERVWMITPSKARARTSRADVRSALIAAARRGHRPDAVIAALGAYYASEAATKDGGQFAKGAHRMIEKDRWRDYEAAAAVRLEPVDPWIARVREFASNRHWNTVDWGPAPGKVACRAPLDVLAEYGLVTVHRTDGAA